MDYWDLFVCLCIPLPCVAEWRDTVICLCITKCAKHIVIIIIMYFYTYIYMYVQYTLFHVVDAVTTAKA